MITLVRIDDRLLHGQVAYSWKSKLGYDAIVIASDEAANDELRKSALKLATPQGVRLAIRGVKEATELVKHEKLKAMKVLVIVGSTESARRFYEMCDEKPLLNIGGIQMSKDKKFFSKALYMNNDDISNLDEILKHNVEIQVQEVPTTAVYKYEELRDKFLKGGI